MRQMAKNHPVIITVEEGSIGGFGSHGLPHVLACLHQTECAMARCPYEPVSMVPGICASCSHMATERLM